ncbi:unnamed protein product [Psylliodes chrysocephalus]|uniref:DM10 domain-containing protein n=1 Tax=Psylliodes chrysocephalus TaxID=3402493 RepID=A0A9P0CS23_9CUCU|nr:unnamed protein product [Psylliodes chrysocephala]
MAGIPKLPGYSFTDPTKQKFHVSQTFNIRNGYRIARNNFCGIGGTEIASNSARFVGANDCIRFDPSLTYGRTKTDVPPLFKPHYALYANRNLSFDGFFKQGILDSPNEFYRVRRVRILYYLEDDTISVFEPPLRNSGINQGRIVKRGRVPKNEKGDHWHWKDLNVGLDIMLYGIVYHTVNCDKWTREYMASQGLIMNEPEEMPEDPYIFDRQIKAKSNFTKTKSNVDKLRKFLEYDGKVLRFKAVWDDRENEYGELMRFEIFYFLSDDTVSVKEIHRKNDGRDPYCMLLRKVKLPKRYNDTPPSYPAIYLELTPAEVTEYYQPINFQIGETIFVLGRDMLLYDCDKFTRDYFQKALGITQKEAFSIEDPVPPKPPKPMPPHDGFGSLEDSFQNTKTFIIKPYRKNFTMSTVNANKYLKYEMVMDAVHPEDTIRRFVMMYSLGDGTCKIREPPIKNSGIMGGTYLRPTMLIKPGSERLNPDYYTPVDFYIGAMISIFKQRFIIVGADLYVYRYMMANNDKFPPEIIENLRNYMFNKGYLKYDVDDKMKEIVESENKWDEDADQEHLKTVEEELKECHDKINVQSDPIADKAMRDKIYAEYEDAMKHKTGVLPYGIKPYGHECANPVFIGDKKSSVCKPDEEVQFSSFTPKHVDTPEEIRAKFYGGVLKGHHDVCDGSKTIECIPPPHLGPLPEREGGPVPEPIMTTDPELPASCKTKTVRFVEDSGDRCKKDRHDLCNVNRDISFAGCTDYQKECIQLDKH